MGATDTGMTQASITDEMIEEMKAKIGIDLRIDHSINNEEATRVAILKFAGGIGDDNPLWTDAEYAAQTRYGGIVAPPSFVISCFSGLQFGWPGLGSFHASTHLELLRPVFLGDRVRPTCRYDGFDGPKPSSFAEVMVLDHFSNHYVNQHGDLVARIHWTVMNYERARARSVGKESGIELPHPWTNDELANIEEQVLAERPRGTAPRWWEDVAVGDPLDPIIKGPISMTDEVAFVAGGGAPIPRLTAHRVALREYRRHPAWAFRDPYTHGLEPIYSVHYNREAALQMGVPMQYDVGFQRQCWHLQLLTHWMGDEGWIKTADAQYRGFVYLADVLWLRGEVTNKYLDENGEPCVDVATTCVNQRGLDVMPGSATLILPSRELASSPLDRRVSSHDAIEPTSTR